MHSCDLPFALFCGSKQCLLCNIVLCIMETLLIPLKGSVHFGFNCAHIDGPSWCGFLSCGLATQQGIVMLLEIKAKQLLPFGLHKPSCVRGVDLC